MHFAIVFMTNSFGGDFRIDRFEIEVNSRERKAFYSKRADGFSMQKKKGPHHAMRSLKIEADENDCPSLQSVNADVVEAAGIVDRAIRHEWREVELVVDVRRLPD